MAKTLQHRRERRLVARRSPTPQNYKDSHEDRDGAIGDDQWADENKRQRMTRLSKTQKVPEKMPLIYAIHDHEDRPRTIRRPVSW